MRDIVVLYFMCHILTVLLDLTAIFVHRVAGLVTDRKIDLLAYVAVQASAKLEPVAVDRDVIFVDHAGKPLYGSLSSYVEVAP